MDLTLFVRGGVLGLAIAAPVGPIGILCIRRTLAEGRWAGLATGLGAATADALYGAVAAFGLTVVSQALMEGRVWLATGGGLFLCWLGWRAIASPPPEPGPARSGAMGSPRLWGAWGTTFVLTVTNPMTILSFAAVFAGMGLGSIERGPVSAASLVLGVFLGSAFWWLALSSGVALFRARVSGGGLVWINRLSGAVLLAFGVAALLVGGVLGGGRAP